MILMILMDDQGDITIVIRMGKMLLLLNLQIFCSYFCILRDDFFFFGFPNMIKDDGNSLKSDSD